ncbi:hypothetical protein [Klenkia brasiliensis]|uniref:Uncharacterized protein n=1 Tax=Klenkia brasiliensis TaxID=333142 RepID=A0A1G7QI36_9ACTN|nr:hypothetical protein [Klenkia brasiliensis]SDF98183.1 hypothetical protein SAMN05660324_1493 [Klenkia brasiliensis]
MTLLLRVGHALGPFHPAPGAFARHHVVRVGWATPKLHGEVERSTWELAVGEPGDARNPAVVDALVGRGLLVRVEDTPEARGAFARAHRVQPLGLGTLGGEDGGRVVGTWVAPVATLDPEAFDIWAWAHLFPDLAAAAAGLAGASAVAGDDPDAVLERLVARLPELLAAGVLYLDVPRDAGSGPPA